MPKLLHTSKIKRRTEGMESILYEAALEGSVTTLLELLQQDRLILDKFSMSSIPENPLHVAALLGHLDFVKEILHQKPELARDLDSHRSSALHKASHKGYVDIVHALLQVNPKMRFACDADGRNPLHLAAMKGHIDLEALKFLWEKMDDPELLNAKNDYGMAILHLAVADKQMEAIKLLTTITTLEVNALSANGFTALDILSQSRRDIKDWEIGELLRRAGAISAKDIQLSANEIGITEKNSLASHDKSQKQQGKGSENVHRNEDDWLEKKRNTLMVVASLIATMGFQAGVNPPPWQDTSSRDNGYRTVSEPPMATFPYRGYTYPYTDITRFPFFLYNTTGFLAALSIILLLISGLPLKRRFFMWILMVIMWVAITAMALTYQASINLFIDPEGSVLYISVIVIFVWIGVASVLFLGHSTRLTVKMIKYFRKLIRRLRQNQDQDGHEPPIASIV
ncbi:Ankyrin repeat family protein [Melia azedarach]|uniref:Ankyrin repeat family protein n=3 Tax=Melia azedarach TaxID=155640 RepID=A0ACC1Y2A3_MELAZ|nr:Ankyrin repeat family protein [Melia azedarach]KAJ4717511.1 Ankyrin repeat family protein [Melia azedarach]KAJ4717515.1 Ankyrin repeat family protein [Melia azedarach]